MEDELEAVLVENAYMKLTENKYPDGATKNEKRSIRRKASTLAVIDGLLYYKKRDGKKVQFILDKKERKHILQSCHSDPTSGHMGVKRTLSRITERFMWPGITKDVNAMIETCDACQRTSRKISIASPELHPVPVVSPWHHIGIDFVGPLVTSSQGCSYILTISDYFTKYVQAVPMESKHAPGVAAALYKVFMVFGLPKVITSDQGREFHNSLNKGLMKLMGIDHRLATPYHPQANGLDERFNQTIQNMLVKFIDGKKEQWQDYLDTCVYAYNTSKHESMKISPFEAMFGRLGVLPVDLAHGGNCEEELLVKKEYNHDQVFEELEEERTSRLETVKKNIVLAQKAQKEQYDRKHNTAECYQLGSLVLKKDFSRKKRSGGKLDPKWVGPYRITLSLGRGLFRLQDVANPSTVVSRVNGVHLKPYHPPSSSTNSRTKQDSFDTGAPGSNCSSPDTRCTPIVSEASTPSALSTISPSCTPQTPTSAIPVNSEASTPTSAIIPDQTQTASTKVFPSCSTIPTQTKIVTTKVTPSTVITPIQKQCSETLIPVGTQSVSTNVQQPSVITCKCMQRCGSKKCPCKKAGLACKLRCHPGRTCCNTTDKNKQHGMTIDLTNHDDSTTETDNFWLEIGGTRLSEQDKADLNPRSRAWLNDRHMTAAQFLLKEQHPHISGLQSPILQCTRTFEIHRNKEFVQVLCISASHWVMVSNLASPPGVIKVYDTLHVHLPNVIQQVIADMLLYEGKCIVFEHVHIQQQVGINDCGLFALANATALCNGLNPGSLHFAQKHMRQHLKNCLESKHLLPFPGKTISARFPSIVSQKRLRVYCLCRQPSNG